MVSFLFYMLSQGLLLIGAIKGSTSGVLYRTYHVVLQDMVESVTYLPVPSIRLECAKRFE